MDKQQENDDLIMCSNENLLIENKFEDSLFTNIGECRFAKNGKVKVKMLFLYQTFIRLTKKVFFLLKKKLVDFLDALLYFQKTNESSFLIKLTRNNQSLELETRSLKLLSALKLNAIQLNIEERYYTTQHIANGTSSKVDLIFDINYSEKFASKQYSRIKLKKDNQELQLVKNEIKILRSINHNTIVKLFEVFETRFQIILVMEYIQGGNLIKLLNQKRLSEQESQIIIKQVALAINYLHQKNIYHRDIKPFNILFREFQQLNSVVIIDLGQASYYQPKDDKLYQTKCGTAGFVAPEIINNQVYNLKIDVYSMGILLYILLQNQEPFYGLSYNEIIKKNKYGLPHLNQTKFTQNCYDFLSKATNLNVEQRFSMQEAIEHPFITNGPGNRISNYLATQINNNQTKDTQLSPIKFQIKKYHSQRQITIQNNIENKTSRFDVLNILSQSTSIEKDKKNKSQERSLNEHDVTHRSKSRKIRPLNPKLVPIHVFKKINDSELLKQLYYQL